jgi:acyl-CoA thioesterase
MNRRSSEAGEADVAGQTISERVQKLIELDKLFSLFGMEVEEAAEDHARVSAVVTDQCLQVHGLAHGAFVFALLDVAFAITVNARVDAVAVQWSISQFRSAGPGEKINADCRLLHSGRRLMVVELVATNSEGRVLAKGQATAIPVGENPPKQRSC